MSVSYNVRFKSLPIRCNKIHLITVPDFNACDDILFRRYASSKRVHDYFLRHFDMRSKYMHIPSGSIFTGRQIFDTVFTRDTVSGDLISDACSSRIGLSIDDLDPEEFYAGQSVFSVIEKYIDLCFRNFVHVRRYNGSYVSVK